MLVYLLRHAKAERESPTGKDEDRPLAPRGIEEARYLSRVLTASPGPIEHKPARVLTSPAERAARTADIIAAALGVEPRLEPGLSLDAGPRALQSLIQRVSGESTPAVLVGHNPVLEDLVLHLTAGQAGAPDALRTGELVALDIVPDASGLRARFVSRSRLDDDQA